jgi:hypothetical protein
MQTETYAKDRQAKVKVLRAVAGAIQRRATAKNDPPAVAGNLVCRRGVGNQRYVDIQVAHGTVDEVIELPKIIDHINGKHFILPLVVESY